MKKAIINSNEQPEKLKLKLTIFIMNLKKVLDKLKQESGFKVDTRSKLEFIRQQYLKDENILLILGRVGLLGEYLEVLESYDKALEI